MSGPTISRRRFIAASAATTSAMIVPRFVLGRGHVAPSDRLRIAAIGAGGKGESDIASFHASGKADIAYLCDVDDRQSARAVAAFPKAKYYRDWRRLFDAEAGHFDAVSVSTPDHTHAPIALAAMQLGKHLYLQKPMAHNIREVRLLVAAAQRYRVVAQMGNQGASADGTRLLREWYDAGLIGDVHTVYSWTNKTVSPQGFGWPTQAAPVPPELDWDLWLGPAPWRDYVGKIVPFNWRGYFDFGSGAIGDMGCHLAEAPLRVLNLAPPIEVQSSSTVLYTDKLARIYAPESVPASCYIVWKFAKTDKTAGPVEYHWMDGGLRFPRPEEVGSNERFGNGNGTLFIGTKGKMMVDSHGGNATLLPYSRMQEIEVKPVLARVPGGSEGHYAQWIEACLAGYGQRELSSPFEIGGPLSEMLLLGALSLRAGELRHPRPADAPFLPGSDGFDYPGRTRLLWDSASMKITNLDEANQFVGRTYRKGWELKS
ncbi:MAG: hypothetical protein RLZZ444_3521 [Pseudomonadota bacterium]|jgi:predicted dehydrogenase